MCITKAYYVDIGQMVTVSEFSKLLPTVILDFLNFKNFNGLGRQDTSRAARLC